MSNDAIFGNFDVQMRTPDVGRLSRRDKRIPARALLASLQEQEDPTLATLLTIFSQHKVRLGIRSNGKVWARVVGQRDLNPDLARLVWLHDEILRDAIKAYQAQCPTCGRAWTEARHNISVP